MPGSLFMSCGTCCVWFPELSEFSSIFYWLDSNKFQVTRHSWNQTTNWNQFDWYFWSVGMVFIEEPNNWNQTNLDQLFGILWIWHTWLYYHFGLQSCIANSELCSTPCFWGSVAYGPTKKKPINIVYKYMHSICTFIIHLLYQWIITRKYVICFDFFKYIIWYYQPTFSFWFIFVDCHMRRTRKLNTQVIGDRTRTRSRRLRRCSN